MKSSKETYFICPHKKNDDCRVYKCKCKKPCIILRELNFFHEKLTPNEMKIDAIKLCLESHKIQNAELIQKQILDILFGKI